jgi:hypothetical protein
MSDIDVAIALINANVNNYPNQAFQNNTLKTILLLMCGQITGGGGGGFDGPFQLTQANFTTSVDCPIPLFTGLSILVYWNDAQRFLTKGVEWQDYPGGGFTILTAALPGFDATANNYTFYVSIKGN